MNNGNHNSQSEEVLDILLENLSDLVTALSLLKDPSARDSIWKNLFRDKATLKRRFNNEGISFATITLPRLGKWVDGMLENNQHIPPPMGFKPYAEVDADYPFFLQEIWIEFLNILKLEDCSEQQAKFIKNLRTFCYCFYKLEQPF